MNMTATTRQIGSVTIVDISGRIVLGEESAALRVLVCNLLDKGHRQILFNLGDVNYIDSAGLGSLLICAACKAPTATGGTSLPKFLRAP